MQGRVDQRSLRSIPERCLLVTQQAESPIPVLQDPTRRLSLAMEEVTGRAIHERVLPPRVVLDDLGVTIPASEDRRVTRHLRMRRIRCPVMAAPALEDRRVDASILDAGEEEDRLMRVVALSALGVRVHDPDEGVVLLEPDLWKVTRSGLEEAMAEQAALPRVLLRHPGCYLVNSGIPIAVMKHMDAPWPVTVLALHVEVEVFRVLLMDLAVTGGANRPAYMNRFLAHDVGQAALPVLAMPAEVGRTQDCLSCDEEDDGGQNEDEDPDHVCVSTVQGSGGSLHSEPGELGKRIGLIQSD